MPRREAIIAIQDVDEPPRKVLRLLALGDGSFAISAPYHPARTGVLTKIRVPDGLSLDRPRWVPVEVEYRVSDLVKLMYHAGGFVQFSRAGKGNIRSGRTAPEEFLIPKGLGLDTSPITEPIETGPTLGADFGSIGDCKQLDPSDRTPVVLFRENDLLVRQDDDLGPPHAFGVEFWVFPGNERRNAIIVDGHWILERMIPGVPVPAAFRVFDLPTPLAFLGIQVRRWHRDPEPDTPEATPIPFGYSLSGPRGLVGRYYLGGTFPADETLEHHQMLESLDYHPPEPAV
jgi:hypothetical protein